MQKMSKKLALVIEAQRALQNGFLYLPAMDKLRDVADTPKLYANVLTLFIE